MPSGSTKTLRYAGQAAVYALLALAIGGLSSAPSFTYFPAGNALVRLSFAHSAKPRGECHRRTAEELAALPANMRRPFDCPRERLPVHVVLELDGATIFEASLAPTGLWGDGPSMVYRRFEVPAGSHRFVARLRDSARETGYDYEAEEMVDLASGQSFVIDFGAGGFVFK